jgi:DNA polymerase-1
MRTEKRLLIVDAHAYAYRSFFAIRQLSSPSGEPTNAIYGFIKTLAKMQNDVQPTHLLAVWDGGLAAERVAALPEYKVNRPAMPDALDQQIEGLMQYLPAAGIASFCQTGIEADDWIATVARGAARTGLDVIIASSDKDFLQLVAPRVRLLNPNDKTEVIWEETQVREKTGVAPAQVVDWLSLIGDSVDNIAGVPGVGPKTAADLLRQFQSVDGIYANLAQVKSEKLRASLHNSETVVRRNQKLIRLNDDMPGNFALDEFELKPGDLERLRELYVRWGFRSLAAALKPVAETQPDLLALKS